MNGRNLLPMLALVREALAEPLVELGFDVGFHDEESTCYHANTAACSMFHSEGWHEGEPSVELVIQLRAIGESS